MEFALPQSEPADRLEGAHKHSIFNRTELQASTLCGCFYLATFESSEIVEWIDEGQTALCPKCPVDSVIGSASGFPITSDFLSQMQKKYF